MKCKMKDKDLVKMAKIAVDTFTIMGNCTRPGKELQDARYNYNQSMCALRDAIYPKDDEEKDDEETDEA